jgi:protein-tyrosine phosphatase
MDIKKLCYNNGTYILIEMPGNYCPKWAEDVLFEIKMMGITPILAHVERFGYFINSTDVLYSFVKAGALAQVNANSLIERGARRKAVLKLINEKLVHIIASDCHSVDKRPPNLEAGFDVISKKLGVNISKQLNRFASEVIT